MARIKWVAERLKRWGAWRARKDSHGLGYARSSIFMSLPSGGDSGSEVPINDLEAALTDRAVESLRFTRSHLHLALVSIYVENLGVKKTARKMGKGESTVKGYLEDGDRAISEWFDQRPGKREQRDDNATGSAAV